MSFTVFIGKPPAPYRYLALSSVIGFALFQILFVQALNVPIVGPLLLALGVGFVISTIASVLMAWKPIEGVADRWLRRSDWKQGFATQRPYQSTLFRYKLLQADRESLFNYVTLAGTFALLCVIFTSRIISQWTLGMISLILIADSALFSFSLFVIVLFVFFSVRQRTRIMKRLRISRFFYRLDADSGTLEAPFIELTGHSLRGLANVFDEAKKAISTHDWNWLIDCETEIFQSYQSCMTAGVGKKPDVALDEPSSRLMDFYMAFRLPDLVYAWAFDLFLEKSHRLAVLGREMKEFVEKTSNRVTGRILEIVTEMEQLALDITQYVLLTLDERVRHVKKEVT